jgi:hypothetical protein
VPPPFRKARFSMVPDRVFAEPSHVSIVCIYSLRLSRTHSYSPTHLFNMCSGRRAVLSWRCLAVRAAALPHPPPTYSLSLSLFQTRILGSEWIQGVCADILSHTWPVRGGDQPRTTPMDFCGSPDHPRRAETAERATWGTKTPPRPPQPAPHPPRLVCGGNHGAGTHTGAHLGGLPGGGAPAAGALNPGHSSAAMPKPKRPLTPPGRNPNGTVCDRRCPRPTPKLFHSLNKIGLPV